MRALPRYKSNRYLGVMPDATLNHVPGMKDAAAVPVLDAQDLSESDFLENYVFNSRPCVIKGAVRHWPAIEKWRDTDYLKRLYGHHKIAFSPHEYHLTVKRNDVGRQIMSFAEALDRFQAEETKTAIATSPHPSALQPDTGGFSFLTKADAALTYPPLRYFFYRNAGTTWHYHPFDETLMCQIVGQKKIGLLNVDARSHQSVFGVFVKEDYYDDPSVFDGIDTSGLNWFSATLDEGDALYIPQMWWHGVSTISEAFGATAAASFRSPLPVLANAIRKMASGEVVMVGMTDAYDEFRRIFDIAAKMGLGNELVTAWKRGL